MTTPKLQWRWATSSAKEVKRTPRASVSPPTTASSRVDLVWANSTSGGDHSSDTSSEEDSSKPAKEEEEQQAINPSSI